MRRLTILLISLLFLVSCTSLMDDDVDRPLWYPNGRNVKGELCVTVMGEGATAAAGRDAAYNELLEELSSTLGRDVVGRYYRELASNQSISEVSLEIESTYSSITGDGRHRFFILAYADEAAIEEQQSEAFKALLESEREVEALRASSLGHYKANNDVEAIRELLRALEISSREGLESEGNSPEELLALALERLSAIEIRLSREDAGKGTVRVRVVRDHGLLSPSVAGAPVNALFKMRTHDNELVDFSVPFVTGQDGSFIFEEYYPQMVDTGTVRFTLDIGDEMDAVEAVTGEAFLYDFRRMAESVQASFDYDMDKRLRDGSVLVIMDEHDEDGHRLPTHWARDAFVSYLEGEGI